MMLHIKLLGRLQLLEDGVTLTASLRPRAQRLLAYLLLQRHAPLAREKVAFTLWPDQPEKEALGVLRRALSDLRAGLPKAQEHEWISAARGELRWNANAACWLDVEEFEGLQRKVDRVALQQAIALYRSELLIEWYDDWVLAERERLNEMFAEMLDRLIALLEHERDYRSAIDHARRLLRHDPLHEETYRRLMRLYAHIGDRAGALRVYQTCVAVLRRELDAEVSAATRAAFEQLMQTDTVSAFAPLPSALRTNNLPIQLTTFIGRESEIETVKQLSQHNRMLTLSGPGGCGKTRLALRVADEMAGEIKDGVWLVELAFLSDPALVPQAVASVLGIHERPARALLDTLADHLQSKELLLMLDNCEHLVSACARLAESLLRRCAQLRLLNTSRERLKVPGEIVWSVPPLSLAHAIPSAHVDDLNQSEAVRLFVDRAASALPTFNLTSQNTVAVAQICQRLDGIPLAIELAAARVRLLTPAEIDARLDDNFRLLNQGSHIAPPRHQTLRATMDWSYALLSSKEQTLFCRLTVFACGWTLEAAEAVCVKQDAALALHASDVLELLSQLIDKSLVVAEVQEGQARYRMLETIRQYGSQKLLESGESNDTQAALFHFCLKFAETIAPKLRGPEQARWLNRMELEHDNLRAALRYALNNEESEAGLQLALALAPFWRLRDYNSEGRDWITQTLAQTVPSRHRALRAQALKDLLSFVTTLGDYPSGRALADEALALFRELGDNQGVADALKYLGIMTWHQSDYAPAESLLEQSLALYRAAADKVGMADTLHYLGHATLDQGQYQRAQALFQDSLLLSREIGDTEMIATLISDSGLTAYLQDDFVTARSSFEQSLALYREMSVKDGVAHVFERLGDLARCDGDDDRAEALYRESLALFRLVGHKSFIAAVLHNLGYVAQHRADVAQALAYFRESLALFQNIGDKKGIAECMMGLAGVLCVLGQPRQAAQLFGAAETLRETVGAALWPANRIEYERNLAALRAQLDDDTLSVAWAEGRAMTMEEALGATLKS